jgi:hypothetical protein
MSTGNTMRSIKMSKFTGNANAVDHTGMLGMEEQYIPDKVN